TGGGRDRVAAIRRVRGVGAVVGGTRVVPDRLSQQAVRDPGMVVAVHLLEPGGETDHRPTRTRARLISQASRSQWPRRGLAGGFEREGAFDVLRFLGLVAQGEGAAPLALDEVAEDRLVHAADAVV